MKDKRKLGLFNKFKVTRTDGKDAPGEKHAGCEHFVLDITHDPFAIPALRAYAEACRKEYPVLANDLLAKSGMRVPQGGAAAFFIKHKIFDAKYVPQKTFDHLVKAGIIAKPFRDSFGDGPGEPYNPHRQAFGIDKHGIGLFTELSNDGKGGGS